MDGMDEHVLRKRNRTRTSGWEGGKARKEGECVRAQREVGKRRRREGEGQVGERDNESRLSRTSCRERGVSCLEAEEIGKERRACVRGS